MSREKTKLGAYSNLVCETAAIEKARVVGNAKI